MKKTYGKKLISLLVVIKNNKKRNLIKTLLSDVRKSLINYLSLKKENFNFLKNIAIGLIFDYDLFDQKAYAFELNKLIVDQIMDFSFNEENIYKIILLDFVLESKNIKHKKYVNLLIKILLDNHELIIKPVIKYIAKIKNEMKLYHYLKIIYYNLSSFMTSLSNEEKINFYQFNQVKIGSLEYTHCK